MKLRESLDSKHVAPRETPAVSGSADDIDLLLTLALLPSGHKQLADIELGLGHERRERQVVQTEQPQRRLSQHCRARRLFLGRRSGRRLGSRHGEPNNGRHIGHALPHLSLDLDPSNGPESVVALLERGLDLEEGGEHLVKLGQASREGDGRRLLDERVAREQSLGGELLGEDGREHVLNDVGQRRRRRSVGLDGRSGRSRACRRGHPKGGDGDGERNDGRQVSGRDEEPGGEPRVEGDPRAGPVAE